MRIPVGSILDIFCGVILVQVETFIVAASATDDIERVCVISILDNLNLVPIL